MNINQERIVLFEADLKKSFDLKHLLIEDESHLHAGHAGAATGGGHFKVTIYKALNEHIPGEIHALTISALTPEEFWD